MTMEKIDNDWLTGRVSNKNMLNSILPDKISSAFVSVKQEIEFFEENLYPVPIGGEINAEQCATKQKSSENSDQPSSSTILTTDPEQRLVKSYVDEFNVSQESRRKNCTLLKLLGEKINHRGQLDVIEMQQDQLEKYRYLFVYEDQFSKFIVLKALQSNTIKEVTIKLLDVLAIIGAPRILQSGNGRNFAEQVVREIRLLWKDLSIVHGEVVRHEETDRRDFKNLLKSWNTNNPSKMWYDGLKFVQVFENTTFRCGDGKIPYDLLFGHNVHEDFLKLSITKEMKNKVWSEEDWNELINSRKESDINQTENSKYHSSSCNQKEAFDGSINEDGEAHLKEYETDSRDVEFGNDIGKSPKSSGDINGFNFVSVKNEICLNAVQLEDLHSEGESNIADKIKINTENKYHFKCKLCQKQYMKLGHLKNHIKAHMKANNFHCTICFKTFQLPNLYEKHMRQFHKQDEIFENVIFNHIDKVKVNDGTPEKCADDKVKKTDEKLEQIDERVKLSEKNNLLLCITDKAIKSIKPSNVMVRKKFSSENAVSKWNTNTLLECIYCEQTFEFPSVLKRHLRTHTNERPYICQICNKRFKQLGHLSQHSMTHTDYRSFQCIICGVKFESLDTLKDHSHSHSGESIAYRSKEMYRLFECDSCKKVFTTKSVLERHIFTHTHERQFGCKVCGKRFKQAGHVKSHMLVHTGERKFECTVCSKRFSLSNSLKKHMYVHNGEKPYQCDVCGARFLEKRNLNGHLMTHTNERPFSCKICGKRYTLADTLRRHISAAHEDGRTYQCEICAKMFKQLAHLSVHKKVHNDERPFQCHLCDKNFKHKNVLKSHLAIHANVRPFECDTCKATFVRKTNLQTHIASAHMNERPYACTICGKRFKQISHLNGHVVVHSNSMPYQCDFCDRRCNRLDNLKKHMRLHTKNKE